MRKLSPLGRGAAVVAAALVLWQVVEFIPISFSPVLVGLPWAMYRRDLNRLECWVALAALAVALLAPRRVPKLPKELLLTGWRACLAVGLLALAISALIRLILPLPLPFTHDEFSYWLQADTFARGRLTNPTHPFWVFFETIHVIQKPTYNSMYFPVQGLIMALGQVLGHPWIGVWLSCAAMCAALTWMLQAWVPPPWALLGGLLAIVRIDTFSYWIQGYWGGAHALLGAALVLGGAGRLLHTRHPRAVHAAVMALGMVILAGGRPYEGFFLCLPVGLLFLWKLGRRPVLLAAVAVVLALGLGAISYYCWRVTGNPLRTPYQVNRDTYGWPLTLAFLPVPQMTHRHPEMHNYYLWEITLHSQYSSLNRTWLEALIKFNIVSSFYLGPALLLPLLMLPWTLRDRRMRLLLVTLGVGVVGMSVEQTVSAHYAAPFAPSLYAVTLQCLRHLRHCRWGRMRGVWLVWLLPLALPLSAIVRAGQAAWWWEFPTGDNAYSWCCSAPPRIDWTRPEVTTHLQSLGGKHLVFVRPVPVTDRHAEWVYNGADIDSQQIVWARYMSPQENQALIRYYPDRRVWVLRMEKDFKPTLEELPR